MDTVGMWKKMNNLKFDDFITFSYFMAYGQTLKN